MSKRIAFTLAEIMIVLAVIGVLTAVLLPVAINSTPNENVMKFKKAHNTLLSTIRELVNSDKYYLDGDLGIKFDGTVLSGADDDQKKYFCQTFADVIETKSVNCSTQGKTYKASEFSGSVDITRADIGCGWEIGTIDELKAKLDFFCASDEALKIGEEIVAIDGSVFYQTSAAQTFGINFVYGCSSDEYHFSTSGNETGDNCSAINRHFRDVVNSTTGLSCTYKLFCIDIDGIGKGEDPFGYGIRADGKIIPGARAQEWLQKSIQEKE